MIKKIFKNKWFFRLIGIAIFAFILIYKINFKEVLSVMRRFDLAYFIPAVIIMIVSSAIMPYRWHNILKTININYSFWNVYRLYFIGIFAGLITPGRVGEFGKVLYLKKDHHTIIASLTSIIIDRLADIIYLVIFGFIGLFFFFHLFKNIIISVSILIIIVVFFLFLLIKNEKSKFIFKRLIIFFIPLKYREKFKAAFFELVKTLKKYKFKNFFTILILTVLNWMVSYIATYFLAKSVGINNVSFFYLSISITITSIITLLPISISGIGTREATLLLLLTPFGVLPEQIVSFSLLVFLTNFTMILLFGFYFWLMNPPS